MDMSSTKNGLKNSTKTSEQEKIDIDKLKKKWRSGDEQKTEAEWRKEFIEKYHPKYRHKQRNG
jgi:hypothetical protein